MEIRNSLRKLLRKLGGDPRPDDSAASLVSKIADNVDGSGGEGILIVIFNYDSDISMHVADKTTGEIIEAYSNGIPVYGFIPGSKESYNEMGVCGFLTSIFSSQDGYPVFSFLTL